MPQDRSDLPCAYRPEFDHLNSPSIYSPGSRQAKYFPATFTIIQCYESHWNATHHGVDGISVRRTRDWCRTSLKWNFFRVISIFNTSVYFRRNVKQYYYAILVSQVSKCVLHEKLTSKVTWQVNERLREIHRLPDYLCGLWQKCTSDVLV